ncbi:MAG: ABC transporter permease [Pikeienuella sp.]
MTDTLFLAMAYLRHHRVKSAVMVLALATILAVPATVSALIEAAQARLSARAAATPLVIGAPGSRLDLVLAALHFDAALPEPTTQAAVDAVWASGLADAVPLHLGFGTGPHPIVGTSLDYFDLRGLEIAEGRGLALLGEAVIGAGVAEREGLGPGGRLISNPETLFDLAGSYPLALDIVGVLAPSGTDDDRAVFVDIKTAWVIAGIGHGHAAVVQTSPPGETPDAPLRADPAILEFTEITPETIDSFHFHGDPSDYPVTAVIARPYDTRAGTLLRGRYLDGEAGQQAVVPAAVIDGLIAQVFRIKGVLDLVVALVTVAALAGLGLALFLSLQLRSGEMATAFRLGAPRLHVARLVGAEALILLLAAGFIAFCLAALAQNFAADAVDRLIRPTP